MSHGTDFDDNKGVFDEMDERIERLEQNTKGSFEKVEDHVERILKVIDTNANSILELHKRCGCCFSLSGAERHRLRIKALEKKYECVWLKTEELNAEDLNIKQEIAELKEQLKVEHSFMNDNQTWIANIDKVLRELRDFLRKTNIRVGWCHPDKIHKEIERIFEKAQREDCNHESHFISTKTTCEKCEKEERPPDATGSQEGRQK